MRPARLFWRILLTYAVPNLLVAIVFLVVVSWWQRSMVLDLTGTQLLDTAMTVRMYYAETLADQPAVDIQRRLRQMNRGTGLRYTIVASDGRVLGDSAEDYRRMANHADRPEIKQAAAEGIGRSVRPSPTLGISMYYLAVPVDRDSAESPYVRVATSLSDIDSQIFAAWSLLWGLAAATGLLAVALTYLMVGRIIKPLGDLTEATRRMAGGDYIQAIREIRDDEIGVLGKAMEHMRVELLARMQVLDDSRQQLATVLGSMHEGVLAIDSRQRVMFANNAARRLLGINTANVEGRPLIEVTRCREVNEASQRAMDEASPFELSFDAPTPNRRNLLMRAARLPGTPSPGIVMVLHDVTELRRLENLRRELVANVSHELKTPLSSIKAYSETLRLGAINDPENNLRFLACIEEQADRLHQLIQDLLQVARVESGQQSFEITAVDVAGVVRQCVDQRMAEAESKSIELTVAAPAEPLSVLADEEGLFAILNNLVSNAIRYTPEKGRVRIGWLAAGNEVKLAVEDTGIGIAPKDQTRIFERFYRVDRARSRELGGTGLGLSIVKHVAQALGGSVSLTSAPGKGSRFEVTLRRADSND